MTNYLDLLFGIMQDTDWDNLAPTSLVVAKSSRSGTTATSDDRSPATEGAALIAATAPPATEGRLPDPTLTANTSDAFQPTSAPVGKNSPQAAAEPVETRFSFDFLSRMRRAARQSIIAQRHLGTQSGSGSIYVPQARAVPSSAAAAHLYGITADRAQRVPDFSGHERLGTRHTATHYDKSPPSAAAPYAPWAPQAEEAAPPLTPEALSRALEREARRYC